MSHSSGVQITECSDDDSPQSPNQGSNTGITTISHTQRHTQQELYKDENENIQTRSESRVIECSKVSLPSSRGSHGKIDEHGRKKHAGKQTRVIRRSTKQEVHVFQTGEHVLVDKRMTNLGQEEIMELATEAVAVAKEKLDLSSSGDAAASLSGGTSSPSYSGYSVSRRRFLKHIFSYSLLISI